MNEQQMQSLLDAWFRETDATPPDTTRTVDRLMPRVREVRQRGRWLPFPLFRRTSHTPTAAATAEYQPDPVPASNGHAPTVIGRTHTMFSPVKAILTAALVIAIGGVVLIGRPLGQQTEIAPAAEVGDYAAPVKVTLALTPESRIVDPTCEFIRGMTACRGEVSSVRISEASDPRLAGFMMAGDDQNQWPLQPWLETLTLRITNDDGAWQGSFIGTREGNKLGAASVVLAGEGAYEGLYAWLDMSELSAVNGVIFAAPPPEAPVLPPSAGS